MNAPWTPSPAELRKIEAAAKNTTHTPTQIAGWLGAPVPPVAQIVNDVRGVK